MVKGEKCKAFDLFTIHVSPFTGFIHHSRFTIHRFYSPFTIHHSQVLFTFHPSLFTCFKTLPHLQYVFLPHLPVVNRIHY